MQRDRQIIVIDVPEVLKDAFRLTARVDENERGPVCLDQLVHFTERVARRMAGPRQPFAAVQHRDIGRGAGLRDNEIGARNLSRAAAP